MLVSSSFSAFAQSEARVLTEPAFKCEQRLEKHSAFLDGPSR